MALDRVVTDAIKRASAVLDRGALRFMEQAMRRSGPRRPPQDARRRLLQLATYYRNGLSPDSPFFSPPPPAQVTTTAVAPRLGAEGVDDLEYPSTYQAYLPRYREEFASYTVNNTVRARLYHGSSPRPVAICLHGWGGGAYWLEERAFVVSYLLHVGLDVVLFQLPFHGDRAPRRSGSLFPSQHVVRTNEAFGQAIHDLRALAGYLRQRGAPEVGVTGMSLGGYTTALWASLDDDLSFAIPIVPAVSMSALMWRHGSKSPARRRAENVGISGDLLDHVFEVHSPLIRPVQLDKERLLIVAGRGDRITPPDQAKTLWKHWGEPPIHWFPGGHLAQIGRGDAFRAIRQLLTRARVI